MKVQQAIELTEKIKQSAIPDIIKYQWLNELEGHIQQDVFLRSPEDCVYYHFPEDWDTELLIKPPYDGIYTAYLAAKIDFANAEFNLYGNSIAQYNQLFRKFSAWYAKTYRPADQPDELRGTLYYDSKVRIR